MYPKPFPGSETPGFDHALFHFQGLSLADVPEVFFARIKQIALLEGRDLKDAAKEISHRVKGASRSQILNILQSCSAYQAPQEEVSAS